MYIIENITKFNVTKIFIIYSLRTPNHAQHKTQRTTHHNHNTISLTTHNTQQQYKATHTS